MSESYYEQYPDELAAGVAAERNRVPRIVGSNLATGLVSSVLPDPNGNVVTNKIPLQGGVAGLINFADFADSMRQKASNSISDVLSSNPIIDKLTTNPFASVLPEHAIRFRDYLPDAPFDWAKRVADDTTKQAESIVPQVEPNSPEERVLAETARGAGALGVPIPGAGPLMTGLRVAAKELGPVARGVATGLHVAQETVLPAMTSARTAALAGGVSGAFGVANEVSQSQAAPAPTDTLPVPPIPPPNVPPVATAGAQTQSGREPTTSNPAVPPPPTTPTTPLEPKVPFDPMTPEKHVDTTFYPRLDMTTGGLLTAAAALVALRYGGRKALDFTRDLTNTTREALNVPDAARFNAQLGQIEAGQPIAQPDRLAAPSPVTTLQQVRGKTIDSNAPIYAYTDYAARSQTEAELMRDRTGITNNNQVFTARQRHFLTTGTDDVSGVQMPSVETHFKKVFQLPDQDRQLFSDAALYKDEMNNRTRYARENPTAPPEQARINYPTYDNATLQSTITQAEANPAIKALLDERDVQHQRTLDILRDRGMIDQPTHQKILADHPNYVSSMTAENTIENPLRSRDLTPAIGERTTGVPVWDRDAAHYDRIMADIWQNDNRANIIQQAYDKQMRSPNDARIFSESKDNSGEWVASKDAGGALPVRVNGELQYHFIHNPALRASLDESPVHTGQFLNVLNHMRNLNQSGTTGLGAALAGHVFATTGAVRYAPQIALVRPKGTFGGYLDKALQKASGGYARVGDPTALLTMPREIIAELSARAATNMSKYMAPGASNWANTGLRSIFGDNHVNALHNTMQEAFSKSIKGMMEQYGAANAAGMSYSATPVRQMGALYDPTGHISVANNMVPELFRTRGLFGSATPVVVKTAQLLHTFNRMVGEASHAQFFRLNDHLPMDRRVLLTRSVVGDPAVHGSSQAVRGWGKMAEYGNIAVQEADQVARRIMKSPMEMAWNATTILGSIALLEQYSAMISGQEHLAHLENELSAADHARGAAFYIPGLPPEQAMRLPLGINISFAYPFFRMLAAQALSLPSQRGDEDVYNWALHGMHDLWNKHLTSDMLNETMEGFSRGIVNPVPGVANTAMGLLTGKELDVNVSNAYNKWGSGLQNMFTRPFAPGDPKGPGRVQGTDSLTDSTSGNVWKHAVASLFGIGGKALMDMADSAANIGHSGNTAMDWLGNTMESYKSRLQESVPYMNGILWNHDNNLATKSPLVARVDDARNSLKFAANWKSDLTWEGYTRSKGAPLPLAPGQAPKVSHDPLMEQMFATAGALGNQIETKLMPSITDLEKQRSELRRSPMSPEAVTVLKNNYTREIQAKYERVAGMVNQINDRMSALAGKRVTVNTINWGKDSSQFNDPPPPQNTATTVPGIY